jgi:hypothetical protein
MRPNSVCLHLFLAALLCIPPTSRLRAQLVPSPRVFFYMTHPTQIHGGTPSGLTINLLLSRNAPPPQETFTVISLTGLACCVPGNGDICTFRVSGAGSAAFVATSAPPNSSEVKASGPFAFARSGTYVVTLIYGCRDTTSGSFSVSEGTTTWHVSVKPDEECQVLGNPCCFASSGNCCPSHLCSSPPPPRNFTPLLRSKRVE